MNDVNQVVCTSGLNLKSAFTSSEWLFGDLNNYIFCKTNIFFFVFCKIRLIFRLFLYYIITDKLDMCEPLCISVLYVMDMSKAPCI